MCGLILSASSRTTKNGNQYVGPGIDPVLQSRNLAAGGNRPRAGAARLACDHRRSAGSRFGVSPDRPTQSHRRDDCRYSARPVAPGPHGARTLGPCLSVNHPAACLRDRSNRRHPVHVPGRNPARHESAQRAAGCSPGNLAGQHRRALCAGRCARLMALSRALHTERSIYRVRTVHRRGDVSHRLPGAGPHSHRSSYAD